MNSEGIEAVKRKLAEIDTTVKKLDPAIRAAAFDVLAPLYFDVADTSKYEAPARKGASKHRIEEVGDRNEFYEQHEHGKPSDNVLLIAAWLYSQYGKFPITRAHIDSEAADTGVTVPERADNTMRVAKHDGKALFRQKGKGWELTVCGESRLKEAYAVRRGTKRPPSNDTDKEE